MHDKRVFGWKLYYQPQSVTVVTVCLALSPAPPPAPPQRRAAHTTTNKKQRRTPRAAHVTTYTIMRLAEGMGDGATDDVAVEAWEASEVSGSAAAAAAARRVRARWRRRA